MAGLVRDNGVDLVFKALDRSVSISQKLLTFIHPTKIHESIRVFDR